MPPKPKASAKATNPEPKAVSEPPPETVGEQSTLRFYQTNPIKKRFEDVGFPGLTPSEKKTYTHANLILPVVQRAVPLSNKSEREFWKHVAKEALPVRRLSSKGYSWGRDKHGRDVGSYRLDDFRKRALDQARLTALDILHRQFLARREVALSRGSDLPEEDIEEEKKRRRAMAELKRDLYGLIPGPLANDPEWDDVVPIPQAEPEDALAKIAYPDDYAEAVSYLRAVMAAEEYSPRCLRLTELVISINPSHYTVWLYRFKILTRLGLSVPDEIAWLNGVAMESLKNYQIWNHRQLLLDHHYAAISSSSSSSPDNNNNKDDALKKFAKSEVDFITKILAEDTKNYHVWSYRQFLVQKTGLFTAPELGATQNMIEDDVRNNSAWSHRFFLVFSDPKSSTPGVLPTQRDPGVPDSVVDRELNYAKEKILIAPQNQSAWNYLRGVLVKGGRALASVEEFASQFFSDLGLEGEQVRSSHALDIMSEIYQEKGDLDNARLCLRRLWEKWDPIREGYWKYRASELKSTAAADS